MARFQSSLVALVLLLSSLSASLALSPPRALLAQQLQYDQKLSDIDRHALGLDSIGSTSRWGFISDTEGGGKLEDGSFSLSTGNISNSAPFSNKTISSASSCEATYGVLPCTDTVIGNLFLLAAYGYLLFVAAKLLSEGSELLLTVLDAGIIGGLLLPILGALPDSILILVSGLGGTQAEAQEQVLVGIGLLAGSIVMLLTVLWGSCLLLGRCDLEFENEKLTAIDKTLTRPFDLKGTGVENDDLTKLSARIMIASIVPFIVAQLPSIFNFSSTGNIHVLIACVLSFGGLLGYCLYQVFTPWIQERRKEIAQRMFIQAKAMERFVKPLDRANLIDENGDLDIEFSRKLFHSIDLDKDGALTKKEAALLLRATLVGEDLDDEMLNHFMQEYDSDHDNQISLEEFISGMRKWCKELKLHRHHTIGHRREEAESFVNELRRLEMDEEEDEGESNPPTKAQIIRKAVFFLIGGTIVAAVFADPLVDAVNDFSTASHIPSFFISFVLLPLASNSSEAVSSILFSARKKKRNMSLTCSQIYGGVTMNSTMGLGIFLALVYARQLVWDFSSEVLVVCLVIIVMGLLASFRKVFPTWMAGIALLLYPVSLGLVAVLDYVAGWE